QPLLVLEAVDHLLHVGGAVGLDHGVEVVGDLLGCDARAFGAGLHRPARAGGEEREDEERGGSGGGGDRPHGVGLPGGCFSFSRMAWIIWTVREGSAGRPWKLDFTRRRSASEASENSRSWQSRQTVRTIWSRGRRVAVLSWRTAIRVP